MKYFVGLLLVMVSADQDLDSYIFQGQAAKDGQFPYHVGIRIWFPEFQRYFYLCGGSLISETFIVTAAHCIDEYDIEDITAFLGSRHILQGTERPARNKIVHPKWDGYVQNGNDIGLLEIEPIKFSSKINSIDLPPFSDLNLTYEAHIAVASGWGYTTITMAFPDVLQYTHLLVISNTACGQTYDKDMPKEVICAADPDESADCSGDTGGPLVDMNSKILIGIYSFGPTRRKCNTVHFGSVFTRVTAFREWIYDNTEI